MTSTTSEYNDRWAARMLDALVQGGVRLCCISPGSRSTPLTAAAARHPALETRIFWDERNAAFFALGYARATGLPAPLICTSGTAAANYFPALIEASVDHVPMLVMSADRPPELLQTGANQTIEQDGIFGSYTRWRCQLPCPTAAIPLKWLDTTIAQALSMATQGAPGPVHLNVPFRKPLGPGEGYDAAADSPGYESKGAITEITTAPGTPSSQQIDALHRRLASKNRGLILIGRLPGHLDLSHVELFSRTLGWPVLVDPGAGLGFGGDLPMRIDHFELLLRTRFAATNPPDVVLHMGGPLLAKQLRSFLNIHKGAEYVHIQEGRDRIDQDYLVNYRLQTNLDAFCRAWESTAQPLPAEAAWCERWREAEAQTKSFLQAACEGIDQPLEPLLARALVSTLPDGHALFVGNSMPIRHIAVFGQVPRTPLRIGMNRGASGIDGLLSCAMGYVQGHQKPGVLYLGDLSLLHNLNALVGLQAQQIPLVIVVPNNHGGGIFGRLPIARNEDVFHSHFHTPHASSLAKVAGALGIKTMSPGSISSFRSALQEAFDYGGPVLIEVETDSKADLAWEVELVQQLKEQLT